MRLDSNIFSDRTAHELLTMCHKRMLLVPGVLSDFGNFCKMIAYMVCFSSFRECFVFLLRLNGLKRIG